MCIRSANSPLHEIHALIVTAGELLLQETLYRWAEALQECIDLDLPFTPALSYEKLRPAFARGSQGAQVFSRARDWWAAFE